MTVTATARQLSCEAVDRFAAVTAGLAALDVLDAADQVRRDALADLHRAETTAMTAYQAHVNRYNEAADDAFTTDATLALLDVDLDAADSELTGIRDVVAALTRHTSPF